MTEPAYRITRHSMADVPHARIYAITRTSITGDSRECVERVPVEFTPDSFIPLATALVVALPGLSLYTLPTQRHRDDLLAINSYLGTDPESWEQCEPEIVTLLRAYLYASEDDCEFVVGEPIRRTDNS